MTTIAFIGVGNMGGPMARNLLKAGESVSAFDVSPAALKPVVQAGAKEAATALDAVKEADVVITMLAGRAACALRLSSKTKASLRRRAKTPC